MKRIFKNTKVELIVILSLLVVFLSTTFIKLPFDVTVPATVDNINNIYKFDGIDSSNININSVSVMSYYNVSVLDYLVAKVNPYAIIEEHNDLIPIDSEYEYASGSLQKQVSHTNALIAGYKHAGKDIDYKYHGGVVHAIFGNAVGVFKVADIITKIEEKEITEDYSVTQALIDICGVIEVDGVKYINFIKDHPYKFTVLRDGKSVVIDVYSMEVEDEGRKVQTIGINYYDYYSINELKTTPSFKIGDSNTLGPSAGLMQSLFTYLSLTDSSIINGLKIVGTGTVNVNGEAGPIGGVGAKICAANLAKADIFFCPSANYEEALAKYETLHTKMKLVKVDSLDDCINYLKGLGDKNV